MLENLKISCLICGGMILVGLGCYIFGAGFSLIVLLGLIAGIIYQIRSTKEEKANAEEQFLQWETDWKKRCNKSIGGTPLDRFYVECVMARCTDFSQPKNIERAKLLAQKYGQYPPCTTQELFQQAQEKHGTIGNDLRKERLSILKEQELRAYKESTQYLQYRGKRKMEVMLTHNIQDLRRDVERIIEGAASYSPTLEKERNWGGWGGIADGLVGPGAGIATALNTQSQNAQIRDQNSAKLNAYLAYSTLAVMDAADVKRKADYEQRILDSLPEKLVYDPNSSQEIFDLLRFQCVKVEVSETGAFRITASVQAKQSPKIFGDVSAVIDGYVQALVYEDDQHIGTAKLVFPKHGVYSLSGEPIMGIGLSGAHMNKKQTVRFEPGDLWMIEK